MERVKEQYEDEKHAHGHDHLQPGHGALLVLEFATPDHERAWSERHLSFDPVLHVLDHAPHIAAANEDADRHHPPSAFAADVHRTIRHSEVGDIFERYVGVFGRVDQHLANGVHIVSRVERQTHHHAEPLFTLPGV